MNEYMGYNMNEKGEFPKYLLDMLLSFLLVKNIILSFYLLTIYVYLSVSVFG